MAISGVWAGGRPIRGLLRTGDAGGMSSPRLQHGREAITYNYYVGTASTRVQIPAHAIQTLVH